MQKNKALLIINVGEIISLWQEATYELHHATNCFTILNSLKTTRTEIPNLRFRLHEYFLKMIMESMVKDRYLMFAIIKILQILSQLKKI